MVRMRLRFFYRNKWVALDFHSHCWMATIKAYSQDAATGAATATLSGRNNWIPLELMESFTQ